MTNEDFSNAFDTLISAYVHKTEFGQQSSLADITFDEYEKSLFLTKAQEEIVKALYQEPFEKSEANRRQLDTLVKSMTVAVNSEKHNKFYHTKVNVNSDTWFIIYEQAVTPVSDIECESNVTMDVYPVTHDDYQRIVKNPFRGPTRTRVLRLDTGKLELELVSKLPLGEYRMRYLSKPSPIILIDLSNTDVSIEGETKITECKLSSSTHQLILDRAIQLAIASRVSSNKA